MTSGSTETRKIHIIDDNELDRYLVKRCSSIALSEVTTHEYGSAEEFLEFIDRIIAREVEESELSHSLVTLDLRMPGIGGLEALRRIQGRIDEHNLPPFRCLVLTSSNSKIDQKEVGQYDFVSRYCVKPMTTDLLKEVFEHHTL